VPHTVAAALGIPDECGGRPMEALIGYPRDRRLLLVLDNCEHLPQACAVLVAAVLAAAPGVRILAPGRHWLGLSEEHLLDVSRPCGGGGPRVHRHRREPGPRSSRPVQGQDLGIT
jgi:non-specific serine/threonine protein kinase